jgi:hypothetical protein
MQYGFSHFSWCWMYTAVSVCTVKLTRLSASVMAAYVYFLLVSYFAWLIGSLSWK